MSEKRELWIGLGLSAFLAWLTWFLTANIFAASMDEGIFLMGGRRVLEGQVPYRDFFAYTGPLIYLLQAFLEKIFGANITLARLTIGASIGLSVLGIYGLGVRLSDWRTAAAAAAAWWAFLLPHVFRFYVTHRWLSAGLAMAGAFFLFFPTKRSRLHTFLAGMCLAGAAWATPSFVLVIAAVVIVMSIQHGRGVLPLALGILACSAPLGAWLASTGALSPMFDNLFWASARYRTANAVPYGFYFSLISGLALVPYSFGAWLAPAAILGGAVVAAVKRDGKWILPLVFSASLIATSYPRMDVHQLVYVTGPAYALLGAIAFALMPKWALAAFEIPCLAVVAFFGLKILSQTNAMTHMPTRVGAQVGQAETAVAVEKLEAAIPAGASAYVFPYLSSAYYWLQLRNPTRYEYLQPGMMAREDESRVLSDLRANAPDYVLWQLLPSEQVLQIWPGSDVNTLRFSGIEAFLETQYERGAQITSRQLVITIYKKRTAARLTL